MVPTPLMAPNPVKVVPLDINQWIAKQEPDARKFFADQEVYQVLTIAKRHIYPPVANINCAYMFRSTGHPLWYRFISADSEGKYPKSSIMKRAGLGHLNLKSSSFEAFDDFVANPGIANAVADRIVKILGPPNEKAQEVARFLEEVAKWREIPPRSRNVTPSTPSRSNTVSSNISISSSIWITYL